MSRTQRDKFILKKNNNSINKFNGKLLSRLVHIIR